MSKRKSPQPARAPLDETSREGEWSDWQDELPLHLRGDRVIWFHHWLTKPPPTSIHYLVTPDRQYFEVEQNSVLEKWRWRGISHDECERLTKHYLEHGGYDEQWRKVFGLENSEELASSGAEHPVGAGQPIPAKKDIPKTPSGWKDHEPPSDSKFHGNGPIEGTLKVMAKWLENDVRTLKTNNGNSRWIQRIHRTCYRIWFSSRSEYTAVNSMSIAHSQTASNDTKQRQTT